MGDRIYWTRELSVGVEEIDNQHQELFSRVNELLTACSTGHSEDQIRSVFDFLHSYVREHFSDEEALMQQADYPDLERHRRQHLGFCRQLNELEKGLMVAADIEQISDQVDEMVIDWLYEHICMEDRKLGDYLQSSQQA